MADHLTYLYAIVPATFDGAGAPAGVDDARVVLEREGDLGALVSSVDGNTYRESEIESRIADMSWLGPRAMGHDRVVTWASDAGPVVPVPVLSLFRDPASVRAMLAEQRGQLRATLDRVATGREYIVRIFRLDSLLAESVSKLSESVAALERDIASASPGQRYLLARKLETERKQELKRIGHRVAVDAYDSLAGAAMEAVRNPLPRSDRGGPGIESATGAAVLDAAFLVRRDASEGFQRVVTELVRQWEQHGFRFEFTGPWPPYHFVREASHVGT
jgi:hypothetical protein